MNFFIYQGIWAREIGKLSEPPVKVPICPAEHFFLTFKGKKREKSFRHALFYTLIPKNNFPDIPEVSGKTLPCVRDYDNHVYLRRWKNSFLVKIFLNWNEKAATIFKYSMWKNLDGSFWTQGQGLESRRCLTAKNSFARLEKWQFYLMIKLNDFTNLKNV